TAALILLAVACNQASTPSPSVLIPSPTSTPTPTTATPTPSPTVTPDVTPTIAEGTPNTPTPTRSPTTGASPSPSATPSPTPTPTAVPEPTGIPIPPKRDLYELARSLSLKSLDPIPPVVYDNPSNLVVGYEDIFKVLDSVAVRVNDISATLEFVSNNAYWYVQGGLNVSADDMEEAARFFEERIFPEVTGSFGPLWPPEASEGHRITILHARLRGVAGYYSSADEYPTLVHEHSNQRKMIYINSATLRVGSVGYLSTLAHELQHAVQWNLNMGQSTWLNEGLSQVAEQQLGWVPHTVGSFRNSLPTSLVYWPMSALDSSANYGAAFLFTQFLADHYSLGGDLEPLLRTGESGINAVDAYLNFLGTEDDFDSIFGRWTVANYLSQTGNGPFSYAEKLVAVDPTDVLSQTGIHILSQPQYSVRYLLLDLEAKGAEMQFSGDSYTSLLPIDPKSGGYCWWGNRGDSISTTLTRGFDLSDVNQATLRFTLWYEIEEDWDYGYVQVSTDGGSTWDILPGALSTPSNPVGNSFGPGYSGASDGWVEDQVDLTPYAGEEILVRFHYVTDDAINGTGLCLDTISLPEVGFFDDASQNQGWTSEGFFRTNNQVPQGYTVWLIESRDGEKAVRQVELDGSNQGKIVVPDLDAIDEALVIVGSLARGSSQPAEYRLTLRSLD
ncbi:MAG: hypothetical protein V3U95_03005, partial [Dehalococcoidia bacterium]